MLRYLLPALAHLVVLPMTLTGLALDALDAIADDEHRLADAALLLVAVLVIGSALAGWLD